LHQDKAPERALCRFGEVSVIACDAEKKATLADAFNKAERED